MNHSLERTNRLGEDFIGMCVLCGKEGLTAKQANEFCPNPKNIRPDSVIINAIEGKGKVTNKS